MSDVQGSIAVSFGNVIVVDNPQSPLTREKGWQQFTVKDLFLNAAARETVGAELTKLNGRSCPAKEQLAKKVTAWLKGPKNQQLLARKLDDTIRATVVDEVVSMTAGCRSKGDTLLAHLADQINRRQMFDAREKA